MTDYNHIEYGEMLAGKLVCVKDYLTSMGDEDVSEIDQRLTSVKMPLLIAIDDDTEGFADSVNQFDLNGSRPYVFMLLDRAQGSEYQNIRKVRDALRPVIRQIVAMILADMNEDSRGCDFIDRSSFKIQAAGPYADNLYGYTLTFSVSRPQNFHLDKNYWR